MIVLGVDVGGTFTDGWALTPQGEQIRCKVLSSGVIRTTVVGVDGDWIVCDRALSRHHRGLEGFRIGEAVVQDSIPTRGRIRVEGRFKIGDVIELSTGEDAPVIAARILTGTAPGAFLCSN